MDFCGSFCARENRTEKRAAVMPPLFGMVACALFVLMISSVPLLAQSPGYTDFSSATNLAPNGNAAVPFHDGSVSLLRLNPAAASQKGSAWFNVLQPVAGGFTTTFTFRISAGNPGPADGLAFVIQNSAAGTAALGQDGGAIGYGGAVPVNAEAPGIENSLAIEFDTFANGWDPEAVSQTLHANHVAVQSCGTFPNTADHTGTQNDQHQIPCQLGINSSLPSQLADGNPHTVEIEYTPATGCGVECTPATLQVKLDGATLFNPPIQVDLTSLLGLANPSDSTPDSAYVGFTAATGAYVESDDILSWTFTPHTSTTITQNISPGTTTPFVFGAYNYKITPDTATNHSSDSLTVTAIPVDPTLFDPGPNFLGAQCIPYGGNNGKCAEFQVSCGGPDCATGTYQLALNFDNPVGVTTNPNPGLLDAPGQPCPPPAAHPFSTNIFTEYIQTRQDPVIKGSGGPRYSCFVAVQKVTYGSADLALLNVGSPKVKPGGNVTYLMGLVNLGPATANQVTVTDPLPPNTSLVSASVLESTCTFSFHGLSCTTPVPAPCSAKAGVVSCKVGVLAPSSSQSVTTAVVQVVVSLGPQAGPKIINTATAAAINPDPRLKNNSSTAVTLVGKTDN